MAGKLAALCALAAAAAAIVAARIEAAPPPALQAKRAQAQAVFAQVNALDVQFGKVVDSWDGARVQLAALETQLAANKRQLSSAQRQSRRADRRLAQRLVTIYEGETPGLIQVLAGSSRLSDVIDAVQFAQYVAASDHRVADEARRSRNRLSAAKLRLQAAEQSRRATVAELAGERARIGSMLSQRRQLLASIQSEITQIQAREAERQRQLAAAARARLARQQELLRQQAAQRAQATAAAEALRKATPQTPPSPTATASATATAPSTTTAAPTTTSPTTTTSTPTQPVGGGHPQAASIALQYLGIAYQWGGASPDSGFDCSGLVMYVYAQLGIQLPHFAAGQYGYGSPVARDQLQPGDLVFFDGLSHVGIYIGNGQMVHAPHTGDVVKISPLSEFGASYVGARRL